MGEDLLETYKWLTNDFFEKILRKELIDSAITVDKFEVKPTNGKGENYCSQMIAATVSYTNSNNTNKTAELIIKSLPLDMTDIFEKHPIFQREHDFHKIVLPEVDRMLKEIKDNSRITAKLFFASNDFKCFVFENLTRIGYKNVDRRLGLNLEHFSVALKKLGKFHAATAVMGELDKSKICYHRLPNVCEEMGDINTIFINGLSNCTEAAAKWSGYEKIVEKIRKIQPTIIKQMSDVFITNDTEFNVLTHGDFWMNNIMFKYNEVNEPIDALFVDFAEGYWGSPVIDLSIILFTSSHSDVREVEWDNLLLEYHTELVKNLELFKYSKKIPTMKDIQIMMLEKGIFGVIFAIVDIASRLIENTGDANFKNFISDSEHAKQFRKEMFSNKKYQEEMKYFLNFFNRKGYFG